MAVGPHDPPPPFYFHTDGMPDYFPAELVAQFDQAVGRPNWLQPLRDQLEWWPAFLQRVQRALPDDPILASLIRECPESVLYDKFRSGAFQTVKTKWRNAKLTEAEIEAAKRSARRAQRKNEVST